MQTGANTLYRSIATRIVNHRDFNTATYDLAIVQVAEPFDFSVRGVSALPLASERDNPNTRGDLVTVSGYGQEGEGTRTTPDLRFAVQKTQSCRQFGYSDDRTICTEARDHNNVHRSACMGDSGGPLEFNGKLVGTVSRGRNCVGFTAFSKVSSDLPWIRSLMIGDSTGRRSNPAPPVSQPRETFPRQQSPPSSSSSPRGRCPGSRVPSGHYDSGCESQGGRMSCRSPPYPLASMRSEQISTMQNLAMATAQGDTQACCSDAFDRVYCRGPRDGFAPGTPGVVGSSSSFPRQESSPSFPRQESNSGSRPESCISRREVRDGRVVIIRTCS